MPRFKSKKLDKAFFQSQDEAWTIETGTTMFQGQKLGSNQAGLELFPALIEKARAQLRLKKVRLVLSPTLACLREIQQLASFALEATFWSMKWLCEK